MTLHAHENWMPHIEDVIKSPGVAVVIGESDFGKTSFCALLANTAAKSGLQTAVVDGDIGQSEIGPPTTVGLGIVGTEITTLHDLRPHRLHFVGSTSPVGHLLPVAVGIKTQTDKALELGSKLVIVDTTGLVRGAIGRRLKTHKIELLSPQHIIALQKSNEAEHFLRLYDTWKDCTIHRLQVSTKARLKTPSMRKQRRAVHFRTYFQGSTFHEIPFEGIATSGALLKSGDPLEPKYIKFAEKALQTEIYYGERIGRQIFFMAKSVSQQKNLEELKQEFSTDDTLVIPASRYENTLVGLTDEHLELLALGIVKGIDYRTQTALIFTPLRSISPVRAIRFGVMKLNTDGTEIGRMRPGDI